MSGVRSAALGGWLAVGVLLAAYAVSFLDRQILTLLVQPIKLDLGLTDTEIGILQGPAFGLFYATMGLPLGWLADRVHRVRLMAVAIVFWSLMTFASGFASEYWQLLLCRFGVGFGEAALVPAAVSLLADLFEPQRRALPVSVFTAGLAVGSGLSLILGGSFIAFAQTGASSLPIIGVWFVDREPWQVVFMLAGLAGGPIALLVLLLREPRAMTLADGDIRAKDHSSDARWQSLGAAWHHLVRQRAFVVPMLASMCALYVISTAVSAWLPSIFIRDHGWTPIEVGRWLGPVILGCALIGNFAAGVLSQALAARGYADAVLRTIFTGACVMVPCAVIVGLASSAPVSLVLAGLLFFALAVTFSIASLAFVEVTPPRLRGQVVALYLLLANFVGLALGPTGVGVLIDAELPALETVGTALAFVCLLAGLPGLWWLSRARAAFAAAAAIAVLAASGAQAMAAPLASKVAIEIREPWLRIAAPGVPVAAGYAVLVNRSLRDDELVSASSPQAAGIEVHATSLTEGVMRMREVDSVKVPAKGRVTLAPNGVHLMLTGLAPELKAGDTVAVRLRFREAGEIEARFFVRTAAH
jgi:copper(I)-binding protein/predicted MFS family arabinose efflux permease